MVQFSCFDRNWLVNDVKALKIYREKPWASFSTWCREKHWASFFTWCREKHWASFLTRCREKHWASFLTWCREKHWAPFLTWCREKHWASFLTRRSFHVKCWSNPKELYGILLFVFKDINFDFCQAKRNITFLTVLTYMNVLFSIK